MTTELEQLDEINRALPFADPIRPYRASGREGRTTVWFAPAGIDPLNVKVSDVNEWVELFVPEFTPTIDWQPLELSIDGNDAFIERVRCWGQAPSFTVVDPDVMKRAILTGVNAT